MGKPGVLILGNLDKFGVAEQMESLRGWVGKRAEVLGVCSCAEPLPAEAREAKLCVVLGGDGTLLAAGRKLAPLNVPLLGVNMGKLGFLAEYRVEDLRRHFDDVLAGRIRPTERMMLAVRLLPGPQRDAKPAWQGLASNDVAVSAGRPFRMIDLHVHQGDHHVARYFGDGLIVATPTGSTGYNLSVGGPIMHPSLPAVVISPIAPHTLSLRPMVLPPETPIRVTANRVNDGTTMTVDGQIPHRLGNGHVVEIRKADVSMRIVPLPGRGYFQTLAEKLHWGQSPHHTRQTKSGLSE